MMTNNPDFVDIDQRLRQVGSSCDALRRSSPSGVVVDALLGALAAERHADVLCWIARQLTDVSAAERIRVCQRLWTKLFDYVRLPDADPCAASFLAETARKHSRKAEIGNILALLRMDLSPELEESKTMAAEGLRRTSAEVAIPALLRLLHEVRDMKPEVVCELARWKEPGLRPVLIEYRDHELTWVRQAVKKYLVAIGEKSPSWSESDLPRTPPAGVWDVWTEHLGDILPDGTDWESISDAGDSCVLCTAQGWCRISILDFESARLEVWPLDEAAIEWWERRVVNREAD